MVKAKAKIFENNSQKFRDKEFDIPKLKEGELLVGIRYATICSSDLHTFYGRRTTPTPTILGHEIVGNIIDMNIKNPQDFSKNTLNIDDRITWSVYAFDKEDNLSKRGIPQKSKKLFKYGHEKISDKNSLSGGFATHCLLRKGTAVFKLDEDISDLEATPLNCTHATVAAAFRLAGNDLKEKNVLVIGAGMLGLSACAMAKYLNANQVWAVDIDAKRIKNALNFGADKVFDFNNKTLEEEFKKLGGVDVVIETSGVPDALEKGLLYSSIGAVNIWVGSVFTQRNLDISAEKIVRNIITIKGIHNYTPQDLEYAIEFIKWAKDKYPFVSLIGDEFKLDELEKAFKKATLSDIYRVGININLTDKQPK